MTKNEHERPIAEVQHQQSELNDVDVKSVRAGTPKRLCEALSAFANHRGGGVILFGLDESDDFRVVGVGAGVSQTTGSVAALPRRRDGCQSGGPSDKITNMGNGAPC
jgi:predicted HTH transcriptional regulator